MEGQTAGRDPDPSYVHEDPATGRICPSPAYGGICRTCGWTKGDTGTYDRMITRSGGSDPLVPEPLK